MQVSVVIIARDARDFIARCVASVRKLTADVVVVVDNRTADTTAEIAGGLGCRVFTRDFDSYAGQKNYADSLAANDWILSLDADETATPALIAAIINLPDNQLYQAFYIPRRNKIFGKYIDHTNWDPYGLIRLFNRKKCKWTGEIHEEIETEQAVGRLFDSIYHDNYRTVSEFMSRQDVYSTVRAEELYAKKVRFSLLRFILEPKIDFVRRYFLHAGIMDGLHGLFLSYLMAVYHLSVWIKLWQKYQKVSS